jgi:hypothetical protein
VQAHLLVELGVQFQAFALQQTYELLLGQLTLGFLELACYVPALLHVLPSVEQQNRIAAPHLPDGFSEAL